MLLLSRFCITVIFSLNDSINWSASLYYLELKFHSLYNLLVQNI